MDDLQQVKKRLEELAGRSAGRGAYVSSEFLTPAEQALLVSLRLPAPYTLEGGYPQAERRIAWFGDSYTCGWEQDPPLMWLEIAPKSAKFAEDLTHRDFLGALMHLGLRREVLGDLLLQDGKAWLCCLDTVGDYICRQLDTVRRTAVAVSPCSAPPEKALPHPKELEIVVSSPRLDALVAAVYRLSRSESQVLFDKELVFVNSLPARSPGFDAKPGDLISVRGHGRFYYDGIDRETKKGRLRANVRVF